MSIDSGGASDNVEPAATLPTPPKSGRPTPGELLRHERERRGLSVQQMADELHLDVKVIHALESNDFQLLGVPVYAKGHLRKYASVLGLSPDEVITHYQALSDTPAMPQVVPAVTAPPQLRPRVSLRVPLWIVAGAVVAVGALWLAGWLLDRLQPGESSNSTTLVVPEIAAPQADEQPEQTVIEPDEAETPSEVGTSAAEETVPTGAPTAGNVTVRLQFSAASWTEIYDARGQRLMYGIGRPGEARTLSGEPPLKVILGVVSAVAMQVNDQPVPVPRRAGKDATRFTVAADGSVS
ncbi:MAG TPA: RodZ domain-containing protein [Povalibacter sp.]|nr:RodZ domain-containing protein [Povalibacter sp.]